jgi:hypothetical protein
VRAEEPNRERTQALELRGAAELWRIGGWTPEPAPPALQRCSPSFHQYSIATLVISFRASSVTDTDAPLKSASSGSLRPTYTDKHLQLQYVVEDEGVFTMPWFATITYERATAGWDENVCADNLVDFFGKGSDGAVPTATKPDF